ncbi:MAG: S26 family signal peptidase [Nitriliruptoraceae bacterium]
MLWGVSVLVGLLVLLVARVRIVRVAGDSMLPTFGDGALLLTVTARDRAIRERTIVTVDDPRDPPRVIVKRVAFRLDDLVDLRGDNPTASTDSRAFGLLRVSAVTGVVLLRLTRGNRQR